MVIQIHWVSNGLIYSQVVTYLRIDQFRLSQQDLNKKVGVHYCHYTSNNLPAAKTGAIACINHLKRRVSEIHICRPWGNGLPSVIRICLEGIQKLRS